MMHKEMVERKLALHLNNPPIWSKYAWVAGYHNYYCDLHPTYFEAKHRIDVELFRSKPTRIFE
jgi:predicted nicotinamide N-methyase